MRVIVNGAVVATSCTDLACLAAECCGPDEDVITIVAGHHQVDNRLLVAGEEVFFIKRNALPPEKVLARLMAARHSPGVYEQVQKGTVAIAGLGGLGSHIAIALARMGVGKLILVDFDAVEPSNLNRQAYKIKHLGMMKTQALAEEIAEINPFLKVVTHTLRLTEDNAVALLADADVLCEAFDDPVSKAMLVSTMLAGAPEMPIVAASGMAGYASSNDITTRRIGTHLYVCGDGISAAVPGTGLMAPRVLVCAGHQANMVLRLLLGEEHI